MSINSVLSTGLQGVQAGINRANQAGGKIASTNISDNTGDLAAPIVDQRIAEIQVKASSAVIKAGDQMLGTLIDIKA